MPRAPRAISSIFYGSAKKAGRMALLPSSVEGLGALDDAGPQLRACALVALHLSHVFGARLLCKGTADVTQHKQVNEAKL